jgi:hypothetical protein
MPRWARAVAGAFATGCLVAVLWPSQTPPEVRRLGGVRVPLDTAAAGLLTRCAGVGRVPPRTRVWEVPADADLRLSGVAVDGLHRGRDIVVRAGMPDVLRHEWLHAALGGDAGHRHPAWRRAEACGFAP